MLCLENNKWHFCFLYREIFEILDLMKMDMANFTIKQIRPYLQQQSVEYERKKFIDFLKIQERESSAVLEFEEYFLYCCFAVVSVACFRIICFSAESFLPLTFKWSSKNKAIYIIHNFCGGDILFCGNICNVRKLL